jgi:hypothetical protein
MKLETIPFNGMSSAVTGIPTPIGSYQGPVKNCAPNSGNYWYGVVFTKHGAQHVQEVGREKTEEKMLKLGAKP